jgi:hypothetical protein
VTGGTTPKVGAVRFDQLQDVGIACGAILAALSLLSVIYRKGVRPMWRTSRRFLMRMSAVGDQILGDRAKGIPSLADRLAAQEAKLDGHLDGHNPPLRFNGSRPIGPRPDRSRA